MTNAIGDWPEGGQAESPTAVGAAADGPIRRASVRASLPLERRSAQVERRVSVEEVDRLELEPEPVSRHHRPVLGLRHVVVAECQPEDEVAIDQALVATLVLRQTGRARVLVGCVAGRVALIGICLLYTSRCV